MPETEPVLLRLIVQCGNTGVICSFDELVGLLALNYYDGPSRAVSRLVLSGLKEVCRTF